MTASSRMAGNEAQSERSSHFGNQLEAGDRLIMRMHVNVRRMLPEQSWLTAGDDTIQMVSD